MNVEYKRNRERRLDSRLGLVGQGGAHTANEADADMSDSPLTSHTSTGVGGSVSVKKANQLLIPSLSIMAPARKQSERGREKEREEETLCPAARLEYQWLSFFCSSSDPSDSFGAENRPLLLLLVLACLVNKTFCK